MKRAYICDYCGTIFPVTEIREHERECSFNPNNRTCFTCSHCLTDYQQNIKCRVKEQISISFLHQDLITTDCNEYERGSPTKIMYLYEGD